MHKQNFSWIGVKHIFNSTYPHKTNAPVNVNPQGGPPNTVPGDSDRHINGLYGPAFVNPQGGAS